MPKYRRLLPGRPFTRDPPLTEGFQENVGYIRNIAKNRPSWFIVGGVFALILAGTGIGSIIESYEDPDVKYMYKSRYTVKRSSDVEDPSKECYN